MTPDNLDELFRKIAFDAKEEVAQHFKGLAPDRLKGQFKAIDDSINDAKERLKGGLGLKTQSWQQELTLKLNLAKFI